MKATLDFVRRMFQDYYRDNEVHLPPRFGRREYGFLLFNRDGMERHKGFKRADHVKRYLSANGPKHVYYSSAYYSRPDAGTMNDKGWMGADLIFDIDADHIPGADKMSYEEMLERTRLEIIKLSDEFLCGDLGFDPGDIHFVFSGGRGYHIHVTDERVLSLSSDARREIVDYVTGTDLDMGTIFTEKAVGSKLFMGHGKVHRGIYIPARDEPGWRGRMRRGIDTILDELEAMEEKDAVKRLASIEGLGTKGAAAMYDDLFKAEPRGIDSMRERDTLEVFRDDRARKAFMELAKGCVHSVAGETDAPVTKDINRLIRLPGSLHGKSTLKVLPLTREELNDFRPLRDAVHFGDGPVRLNSPGPFTFKLKDREFSIDEGENELPLFAALFAMCQGKAMYIK